jgi:hypothetical protein
VYAQRLPNTQIKHDLFAATWDSIGSYVPVQPLHLCALPTTTVAQTTKNLTRFSCAKLESCGTLRFQTGDGTSELQHRLHIIHLLALVNQILEPIIRGFDLTRHVCKLEANDRVVYETLAKGLALVCILDALLVAHACETNALDDDADTLVVEVCHDDLETLVLFSDEVLDRYLDVFECDVSGAAAPHTLAVHSTGRYATRGALDEQHRHTVHAFTTGAHSGGEVIGPDTVRDPLLLSIDNVVFAILGQLGFAGQVGDIATGIYTRLVSLTIRKEL